MTEEKIMHIKTECLKNPITVKTSLGWIHIEETSKEEGLWGRDRIVKTHLHLESKTALELCEAIKTLLEKD